MLSQHVNRRSVISVLVVAVSVWGVVTIAWSLIDSLPRYAEQSDVWYQRRQALSPLGALVAAVLVTAAMSLGQTTRRVATASHAAILGVLVAVLSVPGMIASASSLGLGEYGLVRGGVLALSLVSAAVALFALRSALEARPGRLR